MFQSVSGHSSEQSTAHYSSRPTLSQLKGVSDTISNWFENHRPQRTQISTVTGAPFSSKPQSQVFRAYFFNSCNIHDKNWLDLSSIFFKICRFSQFNSAFAVSFHFTRSDARVKFDSGVIFLDQSQFFATHSNQWNCFILYIIDHVKWLFSVQRRGKRPAFA